MNLNKIPYFKRLKFFINKSFCLTRKHQDSLVNIMSQGTNNPYRKKHELITSEE